jgi:hypothetical protein
MEKSRSIRVYQTTYDKVRGLRTRRESLIAALSRIVDEYQVRGKL